MKLPHLVKLWQPAQQPPRLVTLRAPPSRRRSWSEENRKLFGSHATSPCISRAKLAKGSRPLRGGLRSQTSPAPLSPQIVRSKSTSHAHASHTTHRCTLYNCERRCPTSHVGKCALEQRPYTLEYTQPHPADPRAARRKSRAHCHSNSPAHDRCLYRIPTDPRTTHTSSPALSPGASLRGARAPPARP